uniref:Uncharacterized protein TCIL3000_9_3860 n=1 Tax=Trypanosoma congolense (strain IL3000) TaxID=1068625 RepID=G0UUC2_TRYCI|nr:unnamed protein product [Trypanosoma congolense IL3000]
MIYQCPSNERHPYLMPPMVCFVTLVPMQSVPQQLPSFNQNSANSVSLGLSNAIFGQQQQQQQQPLLAEPPTVGQPVAASLFCRHYLKSRCNRRKCRFLHGGDMAVGISG